MALSTIEIEKIEIYVQSFNIKYYEVYMEILDHMILSVEDILKENETISLENAIMAAKTEGFGKKGFRGLMNDKVKLSQKQARKKNIIEVKNYFTFPKIVLTLGIFIGYYSVMYFFNDPSKFFINTTVLLVLIGAFQFIYYRKYTKINKLYVLKIHQLNLGLSFIFAAFQLSTSLLILGKGTLDFNHFLMRSFMSFVFTLTCLLLLVYIKIRKSTLKELQSQMFI